MPTVLDHQGSLGEMVFGPNTPYLIDTWDYLTVPAMRTDDYEVPGMHGILMAPADTYGGRDIAVRLVVLGGANEAAARTVAGLRTNLNALMAVVAQWGTSPVLQTLRLKALGDSFVSRWVGRVRACTVVEESFQQGYVVCSLRFEARLPWRETDTASTAAAHASTNSAPNTGTIPVYPVITVAGTGSGIVNPTVTHAGSGRAITYTGTVAAGQSLVLDTFAGTALKAGVSVYKDLTSDAWFALDPGANTLNLTKTSGTGTIATEWRDGFL